MNRTFFNRTILITTITTGSFLLGQYIERRRILTDIENTSKCNPYLFCNKSDIIKNIESKPCLPIFSTVSAAVPMTADQHNQQPATNRISEIMIHGFPGLDHVRSYSDYVLSYDRRNRVPHWVFEHITSETIKRNDEVDRAKCDFKADESIHHFFRSENSDYKRSGFDRGHLAAAGNHRRHQKHCDETFYLSNIAPQVGAGFNRDAWNRLESYVRKLAKIYKNVYVCTGPLYLPKKEADNKMYVKYQVIGNNSVAVPTHFYKVIVGETFDNKYEMEAYVMPNQVISDDTPLQVFQVPPESIERAAGLLFFDRLNRKQLTKINGKKL